MHKNHLNKLFNHKELIKMHNFIYVTQPYWWENTKHVSPRWKKKQFPPTVCDLDKILMV